MKIRTDYVTNSSSSSFILAFNSKETRDSELVKGFPRNEMEYLGRLIDDLDSWGQEMTKEQFKEMLDRRNYYNALWKVRDNYERKHRSSYKEAWDYAESEAGQEEVHNLANKWAAEAMDKVKDKGYIVAIEYGDDYDETAHMEHYVMPDVDSVVQIFSNH